MKNKNNALYL